MAEFGCILNSTWHFLVGYVEAMKKEKEVAQHLEGWQCHLLRKDACKRKSKVAIRSIRCEVSVRHPSRVPINNK